MSVNGELSCKGQQADDERKQQRTEARAGDEDDGHGPSVESGFVSVNALIAPNSRPNAAAKNSSSESALPLTMTGE